MRKNTKIAISSGIDILEIDKFNRAVSRYGERFLKRIFTEKEVSNIPSISDNQYLCLIFSFKEAAWKALPPGMQKTTRLRDMEIAWNNGCPSLSIKSKPFHSLLQFIVTGNTVVTVVFYF